MAFTNDTFCQRSSRLGLYNYEEMVTVVVVKVWLTLYGGSIKAGLSHIFITALERTKLHKK